MPPDELKNSADICTERGVAFQGYAHRVVPDENDLWAVKHWDEDERDQLPLDYANDYAYARDNGYTKAESTEWANRRYVNKHWYDTQYGGMPEIGLSYGQLFAYRDMS